MADSAPRLHRVAAAVLARRPPVGYSQNMLPEFKAKTRVTVNLPPPSGYRQTVPAFNVPDPDPDVGRLGGGRIVLWACVAVGLHVALLLAIFLTPPLRLKASYGPDRWVQIMSLAPTPQPVSSGPAPAAESPAASLRRPAAHGAEHHRPTRAPQNPALQDPAP